MFITGEVIIDGLHCTFKQYSLLERHYNDDYCFKVTVLVMYGVIRFIQMFSSAIQITVVTKMAVFFVQNGRITPTVAASPILIALLQREWPIYSMCKVSTL